MSNQHIEVVQMPESQLRQANELAKQLFDELKTAGMTQQQFGEAIGWDQASVSRWKNGQKQMDFRRLDRVITLAKCSKERVRKALGLDYPELKQPQPSFLANRGTYDFAVDSIIEIDQLMADHEEGAALGEMFAESFPALAYPQDFSPQYFQGKYGVLADTALGQAVMRKTMIMGQLQAERFSERGTASPELRSYVRRSMFTKLKHGRGRFSAVTVGAAISLLQHVLEECIPRWNFRPVIIEDSILAKNKSLTQHAEFVDLTINIGDNLLQERDKRRLSVHITKDAKDIHRVRESVFAPLRQLGRVKDGSDLQERATREITQHLDDIKRLEEFGRGTLLSTAQKKQRSKQERRKPMHRRKFTST